MVSELVSLDLKMKNLSVNYATMVLSILIG